ncbi:MAG TPA: DUF4352 domain-containing protein [Galbitalea sp.]|nr:DUF4352 domain-containing protein [Galbitalea sp.]
MTDSIPEVPAAPVDPASPSVAPAKKRLNIFGLIALILGVVGFVLAVIPPTAVAAWILLVPALVLAIIGLTRKNQSKATSISALILSVVGWIIAIIVTVVVAASSVLSADSSTTVTSGSGSSTHTKAPTKTAGIGDTVTNHDGVAFTVSSATCGLASAPNNFYGTETPTGQFCQVNVTVKNGSASSITLSSDSLTGYIGKASYDSDDQADNFGSLSNALSPLNPGLSTDCKFYVDVPSGQKLSSVKLGPGLSFGVGSVTVDVG